MSDILKVVPTDSGLVVITTKDITVTSFCGQIQLTLVSGSSLRYQSTGAGSEHHVELSYTEIPSHWSDEDHHFLGGICIVRYNDDVSSVPWSDQVPERHLSNWLNTIVNSVEPDYSQYLRILKLSRERGYGAFTTRLGQMGGGVSNLRVDLSTCDPPLSTQDWVTEALSASEHGSIEAIVRRW